MNRPSQSYAAPSTTNDSARAGSSSTTGGGSNARSWASPPDLPNVAKAPSSLLTAAHLQQQQAQQQQSSPGRRTRKMSAASVADSTATTTRGRFGRKKPAIPRPSIDEGSVYGGISVADSSATATKKKRWWDTGSLRGFGKGTRSTAGSVTADSFFGSPPRTTGDQRFEVPRSTKRGTRSDFGGVSLDSTLPKASVPPLPQAMAYRQPSGGIAPLGQQQPSLTQSLGRSNSKTAGRYSTNSLLTADNVGKLRSDLTTPAMSPAPSITSGHSARFSSARSEGGGWNDFKKQMSSRDVARAWTRTPAPPAATVGRRATVVDRIQKELQQDAQFEEVARDPGVVRGDLLARATSIVGTMETSPDHQPTVLPTVPEGTRPGSIVVPKTQDDFSQQSGIPAPQPSLSVNTSGLPAAGQPNGSAQDGQSDEDSSDDDDDDSDQLGVLAEEDEEGSSNNGHEMRASGPRSSYVARQAGYDRSGYASPPMTPQRSAMMANAANGSPGGLAGVGAGSSALGHRDFSPSRPLVNTMLDAPEDDDEEGQKETQISHGLQALDKPLPPPRDDLHQGKDAEGRPDAMDESFGYSSASSDEEYSSDFEGDAKVVDQSAERTKGSLPEGPSAALAADGDGRAVKFEGHDDSAVAEEDDSDEEGKGKGKGKARDMSDAVSVGSEETTTRQSSRPGMLTRRSSNLSMGASFAFSHFLGSKLDGRSSSRRIKIEGDESDSDGEKSEEDEDLKRLALKEQDRLRKMSVGEDFFGSDLADVLQEFDKMDWTEDTIDRTTALQQQAREDGLSQAETARAQLQAGQIVSEVRRRRAAGEDVDAKTIQSEAGGLAASFAAVWLLNQAGDASGIGDAKAPASPLDSPAKLAAATTPQEPKYRADLFAAQKVGEAPGAQSSHPDHKPVPKGVMDRGRPRGPKAKIMAGIPISKGKLAAEAAPQDERTTLPVFATSPSSPPGSPINKRRSVDLGDHPKSKDKPAPVKSALKPKPLKHSKSLADTLFKFSSSSSSPKKQEAREAKEAKKEEKKRARAGSLSSKASKKSMEAEAKKQPQPDLPSSPSFITSRTSSMPANNQSLGSSAALAEATSRDNVLDGTKDTQQNIRPPIVSSASEMGSEQSLTSTLLTSPAHTQDGQSPDGVPMKAAPALEGSDRNISLPPPTDFPLQPSADDKTPSATQPQPTFGLNLIPPTPPATADSGVRQPLAYNPTGDLANPLTEEGATLRQEPSAGLARSASTTSRRSDGSAATAKRRSMLDDAKLHGLVLPNGMTATTVAASTPSGSIKKKSKDGKKSSSKRASAPPLPTFTSGPQQPAVPPKDSPSRRYPSQPSWKSDVPRHVSGSSSSDYASASLSGLSPPASTAGSSVGGQEQDVSPARSTSNTSSSNLSASGASNTAASESYDGNYAGAGTHRAKVRTQSVGAPLNRSRAPVMSAISEWESSSPGDVQRYQSSEHGSHTSSPVAVFNGPYPSHGQSPVRSTNNSFVHQGPYEAAMAASQSDSHSHLPVPRSRMTMDETQLQAAFEARTMNASRSEAGGSHRALSRQGSISAFSDGHGPTPPSGRPMSLASGYSSMSAPLSLASVPTAPMSGAYRPSNNASKSVTSSNVDDRLFERSTMATVSVTSGAYAKTAAKKDRRKSDVGTDGAAGSTDVPAHLQDELNLTLLSLTAHTPPPRKINASQVLVQVITVALDEMDRMLLREKVRSDSAYGWVPGRSFCGRVMEVGWEVKRMRKGDMVFGLQSNRKCGALAEFMVVDQDLVAKAPEDCLTVEQIAALPSAGVLSYTIVRNHCTDLPSGARILILNAHDGIGLLTMQECAAMGLIMVAQCPTSVTDGLAVCEANGAHEVVVGDPLWAMNTLHEASFDLVIDTIGGRRLYDAARRILVSNGHFVTCFGDEHSSANPNFKAHLRSLRRTFVKKDKKSLVYEWVGLENSMDCKEALEAVRQAAENGDVCPRLRSILPFGDAPRAFDPTLRGAEDEPGAVVVRVS